MYERNSFLHHKRRSSPLCLNVVVTTYLRYKDLNNNMKMKVIEFIQLDIDIDIIDTETDDLCVGFVGPLRLTNEGKEYFKEVLNYEISIPKHCKNPEAEIIITGKTNKEIDRQINLIKDFFNSAAGYCSNINWHKWFKE